MEIYNVMICKKVIEKQVSSKGMGVFEEEFIHRIPLFGRKIKIRKDIVWMNISK